MTPDHTPHVVVVQPARRPRWQWYREVVLILLAFAVLMLVVQGNRDRAQIQALTEKLDRTSASASEQRQRLEDQLVAITGRLEDTNTLAAAQDREIRRLNELVRSLGGDPTPPTPLPTIRSSAASQPSPVPGPSPSPSPSASPTASPTPRPTPAPSPSPTCRVEVRPLGCVVP